MADTTVKMTHPNGTVVRVRKEKVEQLEAMGFKKATTSRSSSASQSSDS